MKIRIYATPVVKGLKIHQAYSGANSAYRVNASC